MSTINKPVRKLPKFVKGNLQKIITIIFGDFEEEMIYLYSRWQDERGHEDFKDYGDFIKRRLARYKNPKIKFLKMNKRPFSFEYEVLGTKHRIQINNRAYEQLGQR